MRLPISECRCSGELVWDGLKREWKNTDWKFLDKTTLKEGHCKRKKNGTVFRKWKGVKRGLF